MLSNPKSRDRSQEDWGPSYPTIFMGTSVIFTLLFLGELVLRLKTDRWQSSRLPHVVLNAQRTN